MPTRLELYAEAERRGVLKPEHAPILAEARRRGLVPGAGWQPPQTTMAAAPGFGERLKRSAVQAGKDIVAPILHPVETGKSLWRLGSGLAQMAVPGEQGNERYVREVYRGAKDRHGTFERTRRTLYDDPVGGALDIASVASLPVAPTAAGARTVTGLARAASATGRGASAVARGAGEARRQVVGLTTGAYAPSFKVASEAGKEGGRRLSELRGAMRGDIQQTEVVSRLRGALEAKRKARSDAYVAQKKELFGKGAGDESGALGGRELDLGQVADDVRSSMPTGRHRGVAVERTATVDPDTVAVRSQIDDVLRQWAGEQRASMVLGPDGKPMMLPPEPMQTIADLDKLRMAIGAVREKTAPHTQARAAADQAYHGVREAIVKQDPEYGAVMRAYSEASDAIDQLERELSLGKKSLDATALRKVQSVLRDNASSAYGLRQSYLDELKRSGATNVEELLAGQALGSWAPRGLSRLVPALGAGAAATLNPTTLAAAPLFSPRLMGELAVLGGRTSRRVSDTAAGLAEAFRRRNLSFAPAAPIAPVAPFAAYQAGRERRQQLGR